MLEIKSLNELSDAPGGRARREGKRVITNLTSGVRDPNRVNIFIDGKFEFSLDIQQVVQLGVKKGQEVSPEKLLELKVASEYGKLYQRTLEWVLSRPHSIRETRDYLKRRQLKRAQLNRARQRDGKKPLPEVMSETAELVLDRLIEKKYLDDRKFAEYFVENRQVRKGASLKKLRTELMQKGIDKVTIEEVLEQSGRSEEEEIQKIIAKKRRKYDDEKLIAYLVRQGFPYELAKEKIAEATVEE